MRHYDYIICGAGAAGLSLLMQMMQRAGLSQKKILVVDKAPKVLNDRTWCFWEKGQGVFEAIVHHKWQQLYFHTNNKSLLLNLAPYHYKMIRGIDFYNYVNHAALKQASIEFRYGTVEGVHDNGETAYIVLDGEKIHASYVFNSILFKKPEIRKGQYALLQHFKGWLVKTDYDCFDPATGTLMDFRTSQRHGTTFVYVLPLSSSLALVEYTLFSPEVLPEHEYDEALKEYLHHRLQITRYQIQDTEFGIIPMTNAKFQESVGRVVQIGTAGGQTKASSGYTFQFIQKQCREIVQLLLKGEKPLPHLSIAKRRFKLYDSVLLNVLSHKKLEGEDIFHFLFKRNATDRVLRFLDDESNLVDDFKIMTSLPQGIFMKAAMQEIFKKLT